MAVVNAQLRLVDDAAPEVATSTPKWNDEEQEAMTSPGASLVWVAYHG